MFWNVDTVLGSAREAAAGAPHAMEWVDAVLRAHLEAGVEIRTLPPALAWKAMIEPDGEPIGIFSMLSLAPLLARAVADDGPPPGGRPVGMGRAIELADAAVRRELDREALSRSDLADAAASVPVVAWDRSRPGRQMVTVGMGRVELVCGFTLRETGDWEFGWNLPERSRRSLERFSVRGTDGRRGTGLFPAIDAAVRDVVRTFLDEHGPDRLLVRGSDGKRNGHYASTFGSIHPEGYGMLPLRNGSARAGEDGIDAIVLVRHPEPAPSGP